ncbi:molybdenum cofactor guanylyltransferase [Algoriphagus jejuensis]|uniref:Molybdenum cofactor guanylyltransferase n=2 Tax=Algoriphagus jejuensis TaxID=419934 RepID=A0ABN1MY31_9BACT
MGEEKGLVTFQGKSFLQWILEAVFPVVKNPVLVTKNPSYGVFQLQMLPDLIEDKGPVGGIFTALAHADSDLVLILSCDIPKITAEVVCFLLDKARHEPTRITFLSDGKNDYPLIGVYPQSCLPFFQKSVLNGELKLRQLVESLPHQRVELNSDGISSIQNINTKTELIGLS